MASPTQLAPASIATASIAPHQPIQPDLEIHEVAELLAKLGLPALPVAPTQDPYASGHHKESKGDGVKTWAHCPLTKDFKPEPLYTGKNPSFVTRNGKPQLVRHQNYQNRLPSKKEQRSWWQNSANGIGTLGGWGNHIWLDFDVKQFESQEDCDRAFYGLLDAHPELQNSWIEQTHSGGYRLAVKPRNQPTFTNFALEPGGKHRGEALGRGRFTVLAPTIGPSGKPYRAINRAVPVEIESLEAIGIYPVGRQLESPPKPKSERRAAVAGTIGLDQLGSKTAAAILRGDNLKGDRSDSLTTGYGSHPNEKVSYPLKISSNKRFRHTT